MKVEQGKGKTQYGPGVSIHLTGDEVARAIMAHLVAHGVHADGPRTVTVNGELCLNGHVYVDPSGFVISQDGEKFSGSEKPEMTKKEAQAHLTRWLNSGLVEREPFTATFTHTTVQEPCAWTFREVVKALGGWHYPTTEYNWRGTRHLETIASIPDGVKVK